MTASSVDDTTSTTTPRASRLAFDRAGQGEPLVLLHGQGFSRRGEPGRMAERGTTPPSPGLSCPIGPTRPIPRRKGAVMTVTGRSTGSRQGSPLAFLEGFG